MNFEMINGEFNIYDEVFSLSFKYDFIGMKYDLEIILADKLSNFVESKFIKINLINVSDFHLKKLNGSYNQFSQIRIIKNHDGLENVNYELIQIEDNDIFCKFQDFSYELLNYME